MNLREEYFHWRDADKQTLACRAPIEVTDVIWNVAENIPGRIATRFSIDDGECGIGRNSDIVQAPSRSGDVAVGHIRAGDRQPAWSLWGS